MNQKSVRLAQQLHIVVGVSTSPEKATARAFSVAMKGFAEKPESIELLRQVSVIEAGKPMFATLVARTGKRLADGEETPQQGDPEYVSPGAYVISEGFSVEEAVSAARARARSHMGGVSHYSEELRLGGDGGVVTCEVYASTDAVKKAHEAARRLVQQGEE